MDVARQRLALALGSTALATAAAAAIWWTFADRRERPAAEPGAGFALVGHLGFMLEPETEWRHVTRNFDVQVRTNSLGLRGPEVVVPKPADRYRVLVLGDSFTFGWGVELEEVWHARMARELAAADGRTIEIVDAGVPGWCPLQQFVFLEQRGLELQPDLVLWQLCSNDPLDMERPELELDARRLPVSITAEPPLSAGLLKAEWIEGIEQLDPAVRERIESEYRAGRIDPVLKEIAKQADVRRRERAGGVPQGPIAALPVEEIARGLRTGPEFCVRYVDHLVAAARADCEQRGLPLRVLLAQARGPARAPGDSDDGVGALRAWAAQQAPQVLDTAELVTEEQAAEFYFNRDPHWAATAQPIVAEAVARWLADDRTLGLTRRPAH